MRTTAELPDQLLEKARQKAEETGVSLKQFFISAVEQRLKELKKVRRDPPSIDGPTGMGLIPREEINEAMFG